MRVFIIFCTIFFFSVTTYAQQKVAIFKNNTAFFINEMKVNASQKKVTIKENIPDATFGSLWFYAPDNRIRALKSSTQQVLTKKESQSVVELLQGNVGKNVSLELNDKSKVQGNIQQCNVSLLIVKTTQGQWLSLSPSQVKRVSFFDQPQLEHSESKQKMVLELDFTRSRSQQLIQTMYLRKGISWLPSYHIGLQKDNKAQVTLRATLLNDAEDLKNAEINFVVGIPNFAYDYLPSPLTKAVNVADFVNQLNRWSNQRNNNNSRVMPRGDITTQQLSNVAFSNELELVDIEESTDFEGLAGKNAGDLFFYQAKNVTLPKGGRAFVDVMQAEVDFEHIYEINLAGNRNNNSYYQNPSQEKINKVWHSIRLKNSTQLPWTTGTALITKADDDGSPQATSQDKLRYVPQGGKGKIRLTIAPDIMVKDSEQEITREENKRSKGRVRYDLIKVGAKIELKNYKKEVVKLNITRQVIGEALKSNLAWQVNKEVNTYQTLNVYSTLEWDIELGANESKTITYEYQIFVAR